MKKLIKMYNEKYGNTLGIIDDDFNKEQMYRIYYFIKNNCDDEDIQNRIKMINLDKPKTLEQQLTKLESENNKSGGAIDPTIKADINNVKDEVNKLNAQYKDIANNKADKNEIFTMANMGQDIKEAMTGGSVAIVGKNSVLTENIVDKQVTREKNDYYDIEDTNIITKYNYKLIKNKYYSPSSGFIERDGYDCFYMIPIDANTTYYALANDIVLFDENKTKTRVITGTLMGLKDFTTDTNERYVCLNYSDKPTYIVPGTKDGYTLTKKNGIQSRKIKDNELVINDTKLIEDVEDIKLGLNNPAKPSSNKLPCKMINDYLCVYDFLDASTSNVSIKKSSKSNLSNESILAIATKNGDCSITKTLKTPIPVTKFESITTSLYVPWETLDVNSNTGAYIKIHFNGNKNVGTYCNGRLFAGWNVLKLDKECFNFGATTDTEIKSITYEILPRNNVSQGSEFGTYYFDYIIFNMRMKPTVIISFDQIWKESVDNGAFDLMYNKRLPYSMYSIYDNLNAYEIDVINKHKNICEFSLYGTITGHNSALSDNSSLSDKIDKLTQGINNAEENIGQTIETYAVSQTNLNNKGYRALKRSNIKLARLIQDFIPIGYFDSSNILCLSTSIDQKSFDYVKNIIDRAIKYGSVASLFLHGVRNDGNENSIISGKGMDLTEFTKIINYIEQLRDEGVINVMTYKEFVYKCLGN